MIAPHAAQPVRCVHVRAEEATAAAHSLLGGDTLLAVGIDGPLRPDLTLTRAGRACERRLLCAPFHRHCKPGSTASPMGQRLHAEATRLARDVRAMHPRARLVEAFPTAFLRTMLDAEACGDVPRGRKSQVYWERCVAAGVLRRVIGSLYRGAAARIADPLTRLTHRDERAAAICALTACAAALEVASAVGDAEDGWIWLPPRAFLADWARRAL